MSNYKEKFRNQCKRGSKPEKNSAHTNIASACVRAEAFFRDGVPAEN